MSLDHQEGQRKCCSGEAGCSHRKCLPSELDLPATSASAQHTPSRCRCGVASLRTPRCLLPPKPHRGHGRMGQLMGLLQRLGCVPACRSTCTKGPGPFCVTFGFLIWISTFKVLFGFTCPLFIKRINYTFVNLFGFA